MNKENPVVELCIQGMEAVAAERPDEARLLFARAWEAHQNDYEACVAAHYMAAHLEHPNERMHWNQVALRHAEASEDTRVRSFYPSLYASMGRSYEDLGDRVEAGRYYRLAASRIEDLPEGAYGDFLKQAIQAGQERTHVRREPRKPTRASAG